MKKFFAMAAFAAAAVSAGAEVAPRAPIVPWGAQAEIIITNDLTQQNSDGSWALTADAQQWIEYSYDGASDKGLIQQTNRPNVWFDYFDETTDTMVIAADHNWGGYLTVTNKTGSTSGLIVVGANRYPHFFVTGTDKAKFYFSGSASKAGYPQIEVYEVGSETPVITKTGDIALTKSTWDKSTLLIADGLDKAKSYKIVARTMALNAETSEYTYEGGDIVLQVVKFYGDQAPMREDGIIISGSEIGNYINSHLAAYPEVTDFTLEGSGKYTITEGIVFNGGFTLEGDADAPATIDASGLSSALFNMNAEPVFEPVQSGQYVITKATKIANVKVTGLTKNFIATGSKAYAFDTFTVDNVVAQYNTQSGVVFNFSNGMVINFNITNSTFYSTEPGTGNFIALSGKRPWVITGYESETGKLTVANNTFYNVAKSKQFLNTNTLKGQQYQYVFNSNIFVDVSNKKIYGNMTNNTNQLTTDGQNTYLFDGEFFAETNYNGDEGLQSDPGFKNAAAGDFTIAASSQQAKYKTGDPRWKTPYATDAIKLEVDMAENTDWVKAINDALAESEAPSSITVQFFEAGEYPTTAELNTTSPITIQNGSDIGAGEATIVINNGMTLGGAIKIDGVNIKAGEGFAAPIITLQGNEYLMQSNGFYNLGSIQFKNLSIKSGTEQILYGNKVKNQISELLVENCIVDVDGCTKVPFDFNGGGAIGAFNIKKSTIWAANATSQSLFSTQSGNKATEAGYTTQNFAIDNSLIYNIAKDRNFYTHRQNNQKWESYYLRNSIIVDCSKKGQFIKGMNGGGISANPNWVVSGNAIFFTVDGVLTDQSANESTGDDDQPAQNAIAGSIEFADLANGNFSATFTLADGVEEPNALGDPRWTVTYAKEPIAVSGDVTYALAIGETFTSGQVVEVKNEDDVCATIQYGEAGEGNADFKEAAEDNHVEGYVAYTQGNGVNGNKAGGTFYTIVPKYDGVIAAAIVLNADKNFHLWIDAEENETFKDNTVTEKYYGTVEFNVKAGKAYKFYCDGSKLGFYGFNYKYGPDVTPIDEKSIAEQIATGINAVEFSNVADGVIYNLNGQKVQNAQKGLYIVNGKKVVIK